MSTPYGKARLAATILYDIPTYAVRSFFTKNWEYTLFRLIGLSHRVF